MDVIVGYRPADHVAVGVAFLDAKVPGWREKVDPDTLNMSSLSECILGQVFAQETQDNEDSYVSGYLYGMVFLFGDGYRANPEGVSIMAGFEAPYLSEQDWLTGDRAYNMLQAAWLEALLSNRAPTHSPDKVLATV